MPAIKTAGPKYLSPFHQYEGHEVEQQAHIIHSYIPSNLLLSIFDCKFSLVKLSLLLSLSCCNGFCFIYIGHKNLSYLELNLLKQTYVVMEISLKFHQFWCIDTSKLMY